MMACSQKVTSKRNFAQICRLSRIAQASGGRISSQILSRLGLFAACLAAFIAAGMLPASAAPIGTVTITNVIADTDSVKVQYSPVAGAADYRIFNVTDPTFVKYAGIVHLYDKNGNYVGDQPNTEIDWNGITPGQSVTLEVQAVNAVGPTAEDTAANAVNGWLYPDSADPMGILGSNQGMTLDGNESINGQGPVTNNPQVVAQSAPFAVTPSGLQALPSSSQSSQVVFDNFAAATITPVGPPNPTQGTAQLLMQSDVNWDIFEEYADVIHTQAFVMNRHFMDVLFDGGTPGTNNPLHVGHGAFAMSPQQTVSFSGGQILHVTMEVDAHISEDARRWVAFNIGPASSPFTNFDEATGPVSSTNQGFFVQIHPDSYVTDLYGQDSHGNPTDTALTGAAGQALIWAPRGAPYGLLPNGRGLDDRSRFDLFISQTHFQLYENGVKVLDTAIPNGGLPFSTAKVYFTHYMYHSALGEQELQQYDPYETFWTNYVPYSDERHWDNMGFEVLPSATAWNNTSTFIGNFTPTGDTGGGGSNPTATGTITSCAVNSNNEAFVTIATSAGSLNLRTEQGIAAEMASACYASGSPVTVAYQPGNAYPQVIGRITQLYVGSGATATNSSPVQTGTGSYTIGGTITSCVENNNVQIYVVVKTPSGNIGLRTANQSVAGPACSDCSSGTPVTITYTPVIGDPNAVGRISTITSE